DGPGLPRGRQGLPDRHGGPRRPVARAVVPGPGGCAPGAGLRLSPLRLRSAGRAHDQGRPIASPILALIRPASLPSWLVCWGSSEAGMMSAAARLMARAACGLLAAT